MICVAKGREGLFGYCNRLRTSDYLALFEKSSFDVCRQETQENEEARKSLIDGFSVNEEFREYSVDDLCVTQLKVTLRVG